MTEPAMIPTSVAEALPAMVPSELARLSATP